MANDTSLTLVGNLVDEPDLRVTQSGRPVVNFRVASTPSHFDKATQAWVDGESMFLTCHVWGGMAENVAESLSKGMRVVVTGRLVARSYETREGEKRTVQEIQVDEVGPSLRYAVARVARRVQSEAPGGSRRAVESVAS